MQDIHRNFAGNAYVNFWTPFFLCRRSLCPEKPCDSDDNWPYDCGMALRSSLSSLSLIGERHRYYLPMVEWELIQNHLEPLFPTARCFIIISAQHPGEYYITSVSSVSLYPHRRVRWLMPGRGAFKAMTDIRYRLATRGNITACFSAFEAFIQSSKLVASSIHECPLEFYF